MYAWSTRLHAHGQHTGEYIAVEKVEEVYKSTSLVEQVRCDLCVCMLCVYAVCVCCVCMLCVCCVYAVCMLYTIYIHMKIHSPI